MKRTSIYVLIIAILGLGGALLLRQGALDTANAKTVDAQQHGQQPDPTEVAEARRQVTDDPAAPKVAPKGFDVTVVTYSDYQCPFCRKMHPALEKLMENDTKVRIVYRDWPIFGAPSIEAAKLAIASQWQGKHKEFDNALMQIQGKLSSEKIRAAADKAGVDWTRLQSDLDKHSDEIDGVLGRTSQQAAMMGLSGTPAVLIGPYMVPGALNYDQLVKAVELARKYPNGDAPAGS